MDNPRQDQTQPKGREPISITPTPEQRQAFEEAVVNMTVSNSPFHADYVFYMHLLSGCRVIFTEELPAAAGVSFHNDHYRLYLNPSDYIFRGKDVKGKELEVIGYNLIMPIAHRIGIIKHEMSHISNGHLIRVEDRDFKGFNFASDCALDQYIKRDHLPDYAIYPDNFPAPSPVPWDLSAEQYYDLLEKAKKDDPNHPLNQKSDGLGDLIPGPVGVDDHQVWNSSEGDSTLQKEITKNMVEKAAEKTLKSRGNLPSNYAKMIEGLTVKREVDWKRLLRRITGNKKANIKKTIIRRDRRMPNAFWVKGRIKNRVFNLGVVSDVSGSMSDKALKEVWGSILDICDLYKTPVQMVQVDTVAYPPEQFNRNTKKLERKANGGTVLAPAIDMFKENNVPFDALVVCTDGGICYSDIEAYKKLNKPIIWLVESTGSIMDGMNEGKMHAVKLKSPK